MKKKDRNLAVLLDAPRIPAGMTGFRWIPPEWDRNPQESTGMGQESTGMRLESIPAGMEPESAGIQSFL